jgi:hypothetical protein
MKKVKIKLDKDRHLNFSIQAWHESEKKLKKSCGKSDIAEIFNSGDFKSIAIVLWAGLIWEDPSLKPEYLMTVLAGMKKGALKTAGKKLKKALAIFYKDMNEKNKTAEKLTAELNKLDAEIGDIKSRPKLTTVKKR